jgi:hypothetical protein
MALRVADNSRLAGTESPLELQLRLDESEVRWFRLGRVCSFIKIRPGQYRQTLGSYRDCPARRGWIEPGFSVRGSFDRIV